jgi:hypothetical protein
LASVLNLKALYFLPSSSGIDWDRHNPKSGNARPCKFSQKWDMCLALVLVLGYKQIVHIFPTVGYPKFVFAGSVS